MAQQIRLGHSNPAMFVLKWHEMAIFPVLGKPTHKIILHWMHTYDHITLNAHIWSYYTECTLMIILHWMQNYDHITLKANSDHITLIAHKDHITLNADIWSYYTKYTLMTILH